MAGQSRAFIFDLNGTMIDDMDYHIRAWFNIVNSFGANLSYEEVKAECYGKNGEVLERIFPNRFSGEEKDRISIEKETRYQTEFRPHLQLIKGLDEVLRFAREKSIKMGIGSAAIMFNIDFVLDGLQIRDNFDAIVSADDVKRSKPDPETFLKCAEIMDVLPEDCIVFEDAPKGVEAAANAGMSSVVLTTMHTREEFHSYTNILRFEKDFSALPVETLFNR